VNPCREYKRKTSRPRELTRKPLGQGRIHPNESLSRVRKKNLSAREFERKPLGQGRIHPFESLPRVRKKNLSAARPREFTRKPLGQGRIHPSESLPRVRKKNFSAKRVRKKTSRPKITSSVCLSPLHVHAPGVQFTTLDIEQQSNHEHTRPANTLGLRTLTTIRLCVTFKLTHLSLGGICTTGWPKGRLDDKMQS